MNPRKAEWVWVRPIESKWNRMKLRNTEQSCVNLSESEVSLTNVSEFGGDCVDLNWSERRWVRLNESERDLVNLSETGWLWMKPHDSEWDGVNLRKSEWSLGDLSESSGDQSWWLNQSESEFQSTWIECKTSKLGDPLFLSTNLPSSFNYSYQ